ncbi:uncharacterized protein LOC106165939 [Lingula anatina]|uniref:Uncharacterized protein LOC106165939 n=1 Tax=Lingula anatina TaxID=7574 RepID=A0A1S3INH8_LINAN|nr:uncharacterized protein LOC106165939 [Lingula anatina]|eukprot:XP_013399757.1 uncharacterized protein LOC106165939 [Lingula anatina]
MTSAGTIYFTTPKATSTTTTPATTTTTTPMTSAGTIYFPYVSPNATVIPKWCGGALRQSPLTRPPVGWQMYYIGPDDRHLWSKTCSDLIQCIPGIGSASNVLRRGGNFGCWRGKQPLDPAATVRGSCKSNYQHTGKLADCSDCSYFGVCVNTSGGA